MNKFKAKWTRFNALSWSEQSILLKAIFCLPLVWIGLQLFGLQRLHNTLQRKQSLSTATVEEIEISQLARIVAIAAAHIPSPISSCLTRSLLLIWMLQQRGISAQLRIGVKFANGILEAHAWVEYAGAPINDQLAVVNTFASFNEFPPTRAFQS